MVGGEVVGGDVVGGDVVGGEVVGGDVVTVVDEGVVDVGTELAGVNDPEGGASVLPVRAAEGKLPSYWGIAVSTAAM